MGESGDFADLRERLEKAARTLDESASEAEARECTRLRGKAEGVRLALSYVNEALRSISTPPERPGGDAR